MANLLCRLVFDDWRQHKKTGSIYARPSRDLNLASGQIHSGASFVTTIELPEEVAKEISKAYLDHGAYPVFQLVPETTQ